MKEAIVDTSEISSLERFPRYAIGVTLGHVHWSSGSMEALEISGVTNIRSQFID